MSIYTEIVSALQKGRAFNVQHPPIQIQSESYMEKASYNKLLIIRPYL